MRKVKINDFCEFPMEIDLEPYTKDYIERKEREKNSPISPNQSDNPDNEEGSNKQGKFVFRTLRSFLTKIFIPGVH